MTRVRFNTDLALFDAFPSARDVVKTEPQGVPPLSFLASLQQAGKFDEALSFCAYLLPRREAVAWGCRCLRGLLPAADVGGEAFRAAQNWVEAPDEETRRAAYAAWDAANKERPPAWLALGAAWSGGTLVPDSPHAMPAAPHLTASVVRVALLLHLHQPKLVEKQGCAEAWLADGMQLAERGL